MILGNSLSVSLYCLLAFIIFEEIFGVSLILVLIYIRCNPPLGFFKPFSFSLIFCSLNILLQAHFCVYSAYYSQSFLDL
jgi:hypothetical protein